MKKLFLLLILIPTLSHAVVMQGVTVQGAVVNGAVILTDSCTSGLLFSWHCENADVTLGGIAGGVNNGCSVGDTTGTANSSAAIDTDGTPIPKDGGGLCSIPTSSDYFGFTWSDDIIKPGAGTIDAWVYFSTVTTNSSIIKLSVDGNNYIRVNVTTGPHLQLYHTAGGTIRNATETLTGFLQADTWYHFKARWDTTAHSGAYLKICVDTDTGETNCGTQASSLGSWSGSSGTLYVGDISGFGGVYFLDTIKVYDSWQ